MLGLIAGRLLCRFGLHTHTTYVDPLTKCDEWICFRCGHWETAGFWEAG